MEKKSIQERFEAFHQRHPGIYKCLVDLARETKALGLNKYGARPLYEVCRWHLIVNPDPEETFKMSDNFISRYSRLIMEQEPDLQGFFNTKKLRAV